jgi:hypothetical protein
MALPAPRSPDRVHPRYSFITADLRTGTLLEELPLSGVKFGKRLNDAGALTGSFSFTAQTAALRRPMTAPARTALYAFRDGEAVWGGVIWSRSIDHEARSCSLTCADFWSYFDQRRLLSALTFAGVDQNTIAAALVNAAQAVPGGDIGIEVPTALSGTLLDRSYQTWSYSTFGQLLGDLAALEDGPDIRFDVAGDKDHVQRRLLLGTPRLGRTLDQSGLVLDYGSEGAVLESLSEIEDGSGTETTHIALGPGTEASQFVGVATRDDLITGGWPLLEGLSSRSDDSIGQNTVDSYAAADLAAAAGLKVTLSATTRTLPPGAFEPGDEARLDIDAAWYNTEPRAGDEVTTTTGGSGGSGSYGSGPYGAGPYGTGGGGGPSITTTVLVPPSQRVSTSTRITGYSVNVPDDGSSEYVSFEFGQLLRSA